MSVPTIWVGNRKQKIQTSEQEKHAPTERIFADGQFRLFDLGTTRHREVDENQESADYKFRLFEVGMSAYTTGRSEIRIRKTKEYNNPRGTNRLEPFGNHQTKQFTPEPVRDPGPWTKI